METTDLTPSPGTVPAGRWAGSETLLVGGAWRAPDGDARSFPVHAPATGEPIAEVPVAGHGDVDRAVAAARAAQPAWAALTPQERAAALLELAAAVDAHGDELAALESLNVGKPREAAREEIPAASDSIRFFAGAARSLEGRSAGEYLAGHFSVIVREPVGVVASIAPWNYPLMMAAWKVAPALAVGNAVVLKPSELTPLSAIRLAELAAEILPPGVLNLLTGDGETGAALVRHPGVAMVSLTGDVATGREVARAAAATLKRVHLELGGKAPVVVLGDADLDEVVGALRFAGFANAGQDCTAACRVIATADVHDALVERLAEAAGSLRWGDPADPATELGPLVSAGQRERVAGFVARAREAGATVLTGGREADRAGWFYEPTVLTGAAQESEIVQREVFGPVVSVQRARDVEEAVAWANGTDYGLAASVWGQDLRRMLAAARALDFGTVWLNTHFNVVSEMPHGGFKQSGYGKDLSTYCLEDYTRVKQIMAATA